MKIIQPIIILLCSIILFACKSNVETVQNEPAIPIVEPTSPTPTPPDDSVSYDFTTENIIEDIKILSSDEFEGRGTDTEGALKARNYIIDRFEDLSVPPLGSSFVQPFTFNRYGTPFNGKNVLGIINGSSDKDQYIVLTAHYDHLGIKNGKIFNGADDNASGVAALLAFAEYFQTNTPKYNVILAAFDAEEKGLQGARYFVNNSVVPIDNIVLNLNFDMISRSDANELFAVGSRYTTELKPIIDSLEKIGKVTLTIGHEGLDNEQDWTNSSDHAAFYEKNIPFIYFGVEDHQDYHKATDEFERIDQQFTVDAVQTVINAFKKFDAQTF